MKVINFYLSVVNILLLWYCDFHADSESRWDFNILANHIM